MQAPHGLDGEIHIRAMSDVRDELSDSRDRVQRQLFSIPLARPPAYHFRDRPHRQKVSPHSRTCHHHERRVFPRQHRPVRLCEHPDPCRLPLER